VHCECSDRAPAELSAPPRAATDLDVVLLALHARAHVLLHVLLRVLRVRLHVLGRVRRRLQLLVLPGVQRVAQVQ
jgi:hypothetical protein